MYNYVDLFAGCGGLSLGIERSGGKLLLAVEKSDMAAHTFYVNFVDDSFSKDDWDKFLGRSVNEQVTAGVAVHPLRDVLDDLESMDGLVKQGIDVVVGGPPCQGFSLAGRRNPADVRNKLPWEYLEFVQRTRPKIVVIENVVGMSHRFSPDEESPFVQLQQALRDTGDGYIVQGVAVNALHYGAPQNRPRLMILGLRVDVAEANGFVATENLWRSAFLDEIDGEVPALAPRPTVTRAQSPTVADAIGDLQTVFPAHDGPRATAFRRQLQTRAAWGLPRPSSNSGDIPNQTLRKHSVLTQERFRLYQWLRTSDISPRVLNRALTDEQAHDDLARDLAGSGFPAVSPDGTKIADDAAELVKLIDRLHTRKHSQKALAWDEPAKTVVTLPDDYVHPSEPRILTVREMARFQGFPDDFVFVGKETTGSLRRRFEVPQYSQVGNAVSPFLASAVGTMIRHLLGDVAADAS
nr:DNA cytosine methyltransferase [Leifsonia sp. Leaf325]